MIVTYKFNLDKPEDVEELKVFQQARSMHSAIWEFNHNVKRRTSNLDEKQHEGYLKAMGDFCDMLEENGVNAE